MRGRSGVLAAGTLLLACGPSLPDPAAPKPAPAAPAIKAGAGYYVTRLPAGAGLPANAAGEPVTPKVVRGFAKPVTSNTWWSSLIWQFHENNPHSENLYPHPLTARAQAEGLALGYPTVPEIKSHYYMYWHEPDLVVGLEGLAAADTRVADYSDWTVTAEWRSQGRALRATLGRGLPFAYFTRAGTADVVIRAGTGKASLQVWQQGDSVIGLTVGGHHYGVFGPTGSHWEQSAGALQSDLGGRDYWSLAVLPDATHETLRLFRRHAYAFVHDSRVSWSYDQASAQLTTHFTLATEAKESGTVGEGDTLSAKPLMALYRHQWLHTDASLMDRGYVSPRGEMKLTASAEFNTMLPWHGILPVLPDAGDYDRDQLEFFVKQDYWVEDLFPPGLGADPKRDTYWVGKSLGKHASVLQIADQLGDTDARDHLLGAIKNQLQDWFDGHAPRHFYYDETWRTLIGFPEAYQSSGQMNDHHFHYGYFVMAAAIVARYDQDWAARWGGFVDLLIKDAANWQREDTRFPFLRYMDPYAGHSMANGPQLFKQGNNEEASSEDINFSAAVILWGALTGKRRIRDLGIYLYANQVSAIGQYWFDVDRRVFPGTFRYPTLAIVWDAGGWYNTWFDEDPNVIHGINFLPFTGASLYHGLWPDYIERNYAALEQLNRGQIWTWRDYSLMYLALTNPRRALSLYEEDPHLTLEFGNSRAMLYHWLQNLAGLGTLDPTIRADAATYAVFERDGTKSYVAFNPEPRVRTVHFSDGTELPVPPRQLSHRRKSSRARRSQGSSSTIYAGRVAAKGE